MSRWDPKEYQNSGVMVQIRLVQGCFVLNTSSRSPVFSSTDISQDMDGTHSGSLLLLCDDMYIVYKGVLQSYLFGTWN